MEKTNWNSSKKALPSCAPNSGLSNDVTVWVEGFGYFRGALCYREGKPVRWVIWPFTGDARLMLPASHQFVTHWTDKIFTEPC